ncbi:hypothetical protein N474_24350 [Pseudoalteromonas luteoviolacea CPMOR-2]|uniref:Uncharacterized protein n=1 Tax=Pseudoalteromonas luteoviolacea DSM 6061 TaxID=1365250 RepID=A0A166VGV8_9GAMM|nr:hypothetical protein N475_21350 [Pseudoalteromonas luteoviolacea DSM 6061]KZN50836.1 hypothetical protein N474_24350 [Pseudoalteromonas luteoviolacea CPMOR-2]MBE0387124.1 hypothetical protein [Pseudoalteromonas luteoviolacea DSM 6061]
MTKVDNSKIVAQILILVVFAHRYFKLACRIGKLLQFSASNVNKR